MILSSHIPRPLVALAACSSLFTTSCASPSAPPPAALSTLTHDQILSRSRETNSLVFADFTADWCAPCRVMQRETWPDPRIAAWLKAHDASLYSVTFFPDTMAAPLKISGIPLVIVYRRGQELDRLPSRRSADEVLAWFDTVSQGRTHVQALRQRAAELTNQNSTAEAAARFDLVQALIRTDQPAAAAPDLLWLWQHRDLLKQAGPTYTNATAQLPAYITQAIEADPTSRPTFDALRSPTNPGDYLTLSHALGDTRALADWFEQQPTPPPDTDLIASHRNQLWSALIAEHRYPAAVRLVELFVPAVTYARNRLSPDDPVRKMLAPEERARALAEARAEITDLHTALLATHRDTDAARIADLLSRSDDRRK